MKGSSPNNYDKVRGRFLSANTNISRDSSISSTKSSVVYHEKIECNDTMNVNVDMNDFSPELSYETSQEKILRVSKVAEHPTNTRDQQDSLMPSKHNPQRVPTEHTHSNPIHSQAACNQDDTIINIQIPYNLNTPTEPELWDGNFHSISLHRSIKHITSDSKNIKDSLNFMAKYIVNKQVDSSKTNNLEDFHDIGKAVWNFIFSVYKANWDVLYADNNSTSLRKKIAAKFTPKT